MAYADVEMHGRMGAYTIDFPVVPVTLSKLGYSSHVAFQESISESPAKCYLAGISEIGSAPSVADAALSVMMRRQQTLQERVCQHLCCLLCGQVIGRCILDGQLHKGNSWKCHKYVDRA